MVSTPVLHTIFCPLPTPSSRSFAIVARLPLILADIAVILITWRTQYAGHRLSSSANKRLTFATVMMKDGTMYFVVLTLLNICQMIFEILGVFTDSTGPGILSKFIEPFTLAVASVSLTAILVSSFLTALHKAASAATNQDSLLSMGTVEFRVIGSIGASLPGPGEGIEDETLAGETVLDDETMGRLSVSRDGMEIPRQPDVELDV
ncbi:hypothetical protein NUW54_g1040 [Trametes sanguinea]|uniref:Uncharacterized protein n=1 Tax=Trametes sanguinea TaxID=158606 RepID=A0ACC1QA80_9APHY|nr:hypothetical protein NUW54_g1040 [Trametes sanguinea]